VRAGDASIDLGPVTVGVAAASDLPVGGRSDLHRSTAIFYRTALGRAFRAVSDDPVTAGLMGILNPAHACSPSATGLAMVVVTIAALYLGMRSNFDPSIGPARLIYAFEAVIIGGLGSLWGTLAGGIDHRGRADDGRAINPSGRFWRGT
jgi:branched-chain amino acid transport system permease protein